MCGIVGYSGGKNAADILLGGLTGLEYRGYDSAGISVFTNSGIETIKTQGRLGDLAEKIKLSGKPESVCGIGHTRWASHGKPSDVNSHPHTTERVALVHNGIIENYLEIKNYLVEKGYAFESETDTETAAKLIDCFYENNPIAAIQKALGMLEGSYAFGVVFSNRPGEIYCARKDSPLIIGLGDGENYIASDIPAILGYTRDYCLLDENEIARIKSDSVEVFGPDGSPVIKERMTANWDVTAAQKGGYPHFMLKEIYEQPKALRDTIHPRIRNSRPDFSRDNLPADFFGRYSRVIITACGTAFHAGMVGKALIESLARIPVDVDLASEFRYRNPILEKGGLAVIISQSGETADTLAAMRLAKAGGMDTLAIVNVIGSSIAREADYVLLTHAGPEISVASTKAFSVQVAMMYIIAIAMAEALGKISAERSKELANELANTVALLPETLELDASIKALAPEYTETHSLFYLGRGLDYFLAMEGSLKLKEISYIHSESYAAGELKHGTISLITDGVPVVALVTQKSLLAKITSNIRETRARGAKVIIVSKKSFDIDPELYDSFITLPEAPDFFMPILAAAALQFFAYHISVARGCDVDKPRNLAKSVTIE